MLTRLELLASEIKRQLDGLECITVAIQRCICVRLARLRKVKSRRRTQYALSCSVLRPSDGLSRNTGQGAVLLVGVIGENPLNYRTPKSKLCLR